MVTITEAALAKVKLFLQEEENAGKALRLLVEGGGCSGFQYGLAFDDVHESDTKLEFDGVTLVIDGDSAGFVKGAEIDYVETLQASGFKVSNPNATSTCGCGSSFSV